jgi:hypothetical protein
MARTRKSIGSVGIDAGMLYLGDPCYIKWTALIDGDAGWSRFLKGIATPGEDYLVDHSQVLGRMPNGRTFPAGMVVTTGHGDGEYPVTATFDADGCVCSVTVTFIKGK